MDNIKKLVEDEIIDEKLSKFNSFIKEYGHEVFLRILSKAVLLSLVSSILALVLDQSFGLNGVYILLITIFILASLAYLVGYYTKIKYTWLYQGVMYSLSSYVVLQLYLSKIITFDYKIILIFFIFLFSVAIKNPYIHMTSLLFNIFIGLRFFEIKGLTPRLNANDHFLIVAVLFSVIYMNIRNYMALKNEFLLDQKYLAKSSILSSIGSRYDIESFQKMIEKSAIDESLYKYKLFFDRTFSLYMIFDSENIYEISTSMKELLGIEEIQTNELRNLIDFDKAIKQSNSFESINQKFKVSGGDIYVKSTVSQIDLNGKKLYMLCGYDNTRNVIIDKKIKSSLELRERMVELNQIIIEEDDFSSTLNKIINTTVSLIPSATYGSVLVYDYTSGYLNIECFRGYDSEIISDFKLKLEDSYIYNQTDGNLDRSVLSENLGSKGYIEVNNVLNKDENIIISSTISSPLYLNGKFYGLVCVDSNSEEGFTDNDVQSVEYIRNQIEIVLGKKLVFDEVKKLSNTDVLTGTYNRRYLENTIYKFLEDEDIKRYHFVVIDLDNLKIVNDTYGHAFGDLYIKGFVEVLRKYMRSDDYIVRSGGDEFTLTFKNIDLGSLIARMYDISTRLEENPLECKGDIIPIRFSYGIGSYPIDGDSRDEILKLADERMYNMKKNKIQKGIKL